MYDHDSVDKPQECPCCAGGEHGHPHGRGRIHHEHVHDHDHGHEHGEHAHDGRPHVHLPDGTVRYLEEGELPSAPKRRRLPSEQA